MNNDLYIIHNTEATLTDAFQFLEVITDSSLRARYLAKEFLEEVVGTVEPLENLKAKMSPEGLSEASILIDGELANLDHWEGVVSPYNNSELRKESIE